MRVKAIQTQINDEQRVAMGVRPEYMPVFPLTLGKEYTVYCLACIPDSAIYGMVTLYWIVSDNDRLIPVPSCLFEITDSRPSRFWVIRYQGLTLSMDPVEFLENPYLSEDVFDHEDDAMVVFAEMRRRFESE